ncbi:hypothetical protein [Nonomuraea sp. NPDC050691]|uniref:hypothetical protein n=1 Tax=Nonomuraea sp. NPDC050691 TaxID=3155661 RepID=UPI0033EF57C2
MTVAQTRSTATAGTEAGSARRFTLDLPMMTIEVRPPQVRMPRIPLPHVPLPKISRQEVGHAADVARAMLPPPERVAYYGALGALAVMGVIEWPVAAAIGAGAIIAQRARSGRTSMGNGGQRATVTARTATAARGGGAGGGASGARRSAAMKAEEAPKSGSSRRGASQSASTTRASSTRASSIKASSGGASSTRAASTRASSPRARSKPASAGT